jgi:DNA-binding SARP family transcriptional activator
VLDLGARLGPLTAGLADKVVGPGAGAALTELVATGLLVLPDDAARDDPADDMPAVTVPAVAAALCSVRAAPPAGDLVVAARAAARWYADRDRQLHAASMLHAAGDLAGCAATVATHGDAMLAEGGAATVVRLGQTLLARGCELDTGIEADLDGGLGPDAEAATTDRLRLVVGDARRRTGDARGALGALAPLVERAERTGCWKPTLAWRLAMVHYMTGDPRAALDACRRVGPQDVADGPAACVETVLLAAVEVSALAALGEESALGPAVEQTLAHAERCGEQRAVAAAHLAAGLVAVGDRRDNHLRLAGEAARAGRDLTAQARVLSNQTYAALARARFVDAVDLACRAVRAAEQGAPPGLLVSAQINLGDALRLVGRYEDARFHFERALLTCRRAGLSRTALGLLGLADTARCLGHRERARMAYEEAAELARERELVHVLAPALAGLARLLVDAPADERPAGIEPAKAAAAEALACAPPQLRAFAQVAGGWVALAAGDLEAARTAAAEALDQARASRMLPAVAEALELLGGATRDSLTARAALDEAHAVWSQAGAQPDADRVLVLVGRLPGTSSRDRVAAREASARLAALGVRLPDVGPLPGEDLTAPLQVRVLGGFDVRAAGRPVPLTAWRSRQARTLVKVLVARRGRPVPRGEVCELLWPDDDPQRTAHRLSVLLSVVRGVLDPARSWPADHHIRADLLGLSLDLSHVVVDAEELLRDAVHAEEVLADGDEDRARALLAEVDALYRGEAFDEEPYEAWAGGLREEVRAAWLRSLRRHALLCRRAGAVDAAVADLVRLLGVDPYDESVHRGLVRTFVAAGRHGEARRAFQRWEQAMVAIDAPGPDRALLYATGAPQAGPPAAPSAARRIDPRASTRTAAVPRAVG